MAKDSFAQSIGAEWVQLSILAGVIAFISSVAASFASSQTALSTRQVSQAECRLAVPTYAGHQYAVSASIIFE